MSGSLTITVGLPGSGKTTWALAEIEAGRADVRVNRDDLRMTMYGKYVLDGSQERLVTRVQHAAIQELLAKGKRVIVDDTNLNKKTRTLLRELAERCQAAYRVNDEFLHVGVALCASRAALRLHRPVDRNVVLNMAARYAGLCNVGMIPDGEVRRRFHAEAANLKPMRNLDGLPAIIVDIDGTVADHNGRDPFNVAECAGDLLHGDTARVVRTLSWGADEPAQLFFVSGRDSKYRALTETWLARHRFWNYRLHMRPEGDKRSDEIIKQEIYERDILPKYNVQAVFDDRDRVVAMWRRLGLQVFQCNYGAF